MKFGAQIRRYVSEGPLVARAAIGELLQQVQIEEKESKNPTDHYGQIRSKLSNAQALDIPDLWESLIGSIRSTCENPADFEDAQRLIQRARFKAENGMPLSEAEILANTFTMLTQAKLFTTAEATYALTPAVYEALFGTFDSPYPKFNHVIPSEAPELSNVKEGEDYPTGQLSDRWAETRAHKFGVIIELTRETLITDRTGQVVEQAESVAQSAKYRSDELAALCWQDSSNASLIKDAADVDAGAYYPEATRCALYRTAAGSTKARYEYSINKRTANLLHWDDVAGAIVLAQKMANSKGQYIDVFRGEMSLVVPIAIEHRAKLLAAGGASVEIRANAAAGTPYNILHTPDWVRNATGVSTIKVLPWKLLTNAATASESVWYLAGDSKKQFKRHRRWDVEFRRASQAELGGADFRRDTLFALRVGFNFGFRAVDDKFVIQNTNS